MSMKRYVSALLLGCALGLSGHVHAETYTQFQRDKSKVTFAFSQMGVRMDGQFREFDASLSFDPSNATQGSAKIDIALASVDLGSADFDREVAGTDWFNTKTFPSASFVSSAIKPLGENRYEVSGTLTIKGQSQTVTVPAVLSKDGQTGLFEGAFTIQRGQFKIGEGAWSKFDIVADDVTVNFRIAATAH